MPHGERLEQKIQGVSRKSELIRLIDGLSTGGAFSSPWIDIKDIERGALEFVNQSGLGSLTFSAQVMISLEQNKPADATDGTVVGSAITSLGAITQFKDITARFLKVKVTAFTPSGGATLGCRAQLQKY